MKKIRVGVLGLGNLGLGAIRGCLKMPDMEFVGAYTRRGPEEALEELRARLGEDSSGLSELLEGRIFPVSELESGAALLDVLLLCTGSQTDLPTQGPHYARLYHTVDAYDHHAWMKDYWETMDEAARSGSRCAVIAAGWDPGIFSLQRGLFEAILPQGLTGTFWGPGLSQGHSEAVRSLSGVKLAAQYTLPRGETLESLREGRASAEDLTAAKSHRRLVYVVPEEGVDLEVLASKIREMPDYFAPYETEVRFISEEEFLREHQGMPHGGTVLRSGDGASAAPTCLDFSLKLGSNPEFTASVMLACARACVRLAERGVYGAQTLLDLPVSCLMEGEREDWLGRLV